MGFNSKLKIGGLIFIYLILVKIPVKNLKPLKARIKQRLFSLSEIILLGGNISWKNFPQIPLISLQFRYRSFNCEIGNLKIGISSKAILHKDIFFLPVKIQTLVLNQEKAEPENRNSESKSNNQGLYEAENLKKFLNKFSTKYRPKDLKIQSFQLTRNNNRVLDTGILFAGANFKLEIRKCFLHKESIIVTGEIFPKKNYWLIKQFEFSYNDVYIKIKMLLFSFRDKNSVNIRVLEIESGSLVKFIGKIKIGRIKLLPRLEFELNDHLLFTVEENSFFEKLKFQLQILFKIQPIKECHFQFILERSTFLDLVHSLPQDMDWIESVNIEGIMDYLDILFCCDLEEPDKYIFQVKAKNDFSSVLDYKSLFIEQTKFGSSDAQNFLEFSQFPPSLIKVIVETEDPNFFTHRGIDTYFLGYALSQNIKEKGFKRGGSTITMQLVRNLFLDKEKTVFRKFEEFLLTYILENHSSISKEEILELYLNIIEFAPDVYGLKEACQYYFKRDIEELGLKEFFILSYIIPRPKFFMDALEINSLQLKRNLFKHFNFLVDRLSSFSLLGSNEITEIYSPIVIRGVVLNFQEDYAKKWRQNHKDFMDKTNS